MNELLALGAGSFFANLVGRGPVGKSVAKLIDTVSDRIGVGTERRRTDAEIESKKKQVIADEDLTILRKANKLSQSGRVDALVKDQLDLAVHQSSDNLIQRQLEFVDRMESRLLSKEARRQVNIEAIVGVAASVMPDSASDEPVDEDWVSQFFEYCQDFSDDQMRILWGKILAGQVVRPGSFSLRTLLFLKTLTRVEADVFTRFCSFAWRTNEDTFYLLITPHRENVRHQEFNGVGEDEYLLLEDLGLITTAPMQGYVSSHRADCVLQQFAGAKCAVVSMSYFGNEHVFVHQSADQSGAASYLMLIGCARLTDIGQELITICGAVPDPEYQSWAIDKLKQDGWNLTSGVSVSFIHDK